MNIKYIPIRKLPKIKIHKKKVKIKIKTHNISDFIKIKVTQTKL
jgi:hypothetical protein